MKVLIILILLSYMLLFFSPEKVLSDYSSQSYTNGMIHSFSLCLFCERLLSPDCLQFSLLSRTRTKLISDVVGVMVLTRTVYTQIKS